MSAALSRRYGRARYAPPLAELPLDEQLCLHRLTVERHRELEDLPEHYQRLILEAEADLERSSRATAAPSLAVSQR